MEVRYNSSLSVADNLARPVVRDAWRQLQSILALETQSLLSPSAARTLRRSLQRRLISTGEQAIDFLCSAFRTTPLVSSRRAIPQRDCAKLLFSRGVEAELNSLFRCFPALEELWSIQASNWVEFVSQFLRDANAFAKTRFGLGERAGVIRRIVPDLADVRSGGKSVFRVRFGQGQDWVYKPRPGAAEKWFFRLLGEVNRLGFSRSLYLAEIVEGSGHHWMRFVPHRVCATDKEVEDFYYRAGALLCLIHVLRGVDFHAGNLIACASQPVVVDCETLLHPATRLPVEFALEELSIFRTGMIPSVTRDAMVDDVSALGRRVRGAHSVVHRGKLVDVRLHVNVIVAGFEEIHRLLAVDPRIRARTREVVANPPFHGCRAIRRPTSYYYSALVQSLHPCALENSRKRHSVLSNRLTAPHIAARQIKSEMEALIAGDIPTFRIRVARPRTVSGSDLRECIRCISAAFLPA